MPFSPSDIHDAHPDEVGIYDAQFRGFGRVRSFAGPCATATTDEDPWTIREVPGALSGWR